MSAPESPQTLPDRWWRPRPFAGSGWEMFFMRAGFAVLIFSAIKWQTSNLTEQKFPNGIARFFDLTWIAKSPPGIVHETLTILGLILYVVGLFPVLGLLPALFFSIVIGTLMNSQGAINHSTQLVTMIILAQFLVYLIPRKPALHHWRQPARAVQQSAIHWSLIVIAAAYVIAGLIKLVNTNGLWIRDTPMLAVQLLKTNWAAYHDTLEMPPGWLQSVTQALVDHPMLAQLLFGGGLFVELAAFVILINRRWALVGGLAIIVLHVSISQIMGLNFNNHICLALIFLVNVPGWFLGPKAPPSPATD